MVGLFRAVPKQRRTTSISYPLLPLSINAQCSGSSGPIVPTDVVHESPSMPSTHISAFALFVIHKYNVVVNNPPIFFGKKGGIKNAENGAFFKNKNTDTNRWFIFGIYLYLFYPKIRPHVNTILTINEYEFEIKTGALPRLFILMLPMSLQV